ncbi:hypothetical protein [Acidisoma silvae]|uniref:Calcium-binding protein n=1 Tax=Acidisoma silvae TaxID=2802396 RepID=A0A964E0B5_9PROT|nr:hypothetical protein [Acidisoma silvae]MCB8877171.1 hypothetical protein [Acidisoma silvae]
MKQRNFSLSCAVTFVLTAGLAPTAMAAQAVSATEFLASLGVNTHLNYTDGSYADYDSVIADLQYLGVHQVRDAVPDPRGGIPYQNDVTAIDAMAASGNRFDFIVNPALPVGITTDEIATLERAHPGSVFAIEGPNETNNSPVTYQGLAGKAAAVAFQRALYRQVHATPILRGKSVYYYTGLDATNSLTGLADFANAHPYSYQGQQPAARIASAFAKQYLMAPTYPKVITEAGYFNVPMANDGVDDATQAKNNLNLYMDAFAQGNARTFIYQLVSAYPNGGSDTQSGLFRMDHSPKPAADAIHNLTTILADAGKAGFKPAALDYSVANLPVTAHSMLLQKSSGQFDIILWSEPADWNNITHEAIVNPPVSATVTISGATGNMAVYDPMLGNQPIKHVLHTGQIAVNLVDHPVIIEVQPTRPDVLTAENLPPAGAAN